MYGNEDKGVGEGRRIVGVGLRASVDFAIQPGKASFSECSPRIVAKAWDGSIAAWLAFKSRMSLTAFVNDDRIESTLCLIGVHFTSLVTRH
jgi:hypothetical protein